MSDIESKEQEERQHQQTMLGPIFPHRWIDAQDQYNKWYEAQIIKIDDLNHQRIKVHYKGWKSKFDEWIDLSINPEKVCTLHTHTVRSHAQLNNNSNIHISQITIGFKCDCLDSSDKWYAAEIVQIDNDLTHQLLKIHYLEWNSMYDEWIHFNSYRLALLHTYVPCVRIHMHMPPIILYRKTKPKITKPTKKPTTRVISQSTTNLAHQSGSNTPLSDRKIRRRQIRRSNTSPNATTLTPTTTNNNNTNNSSTNAAMNSEQFMSNFKPSVADEENFTDLLTSKGYDIKHTGEDGNCLFRAIAHQMYGNEEFHVQLRAYCVKYLVLEKEYFKAYIPYDFDDYCQHMSKDGIWGDNIEIQAFSEIYARPIEIYAYSNIPMKTFSNDKISAHGKQPLRLSYHCNSHYNSVVSVDDGWVGLVEDEMGVIEQRRLAYSAMGSSAAVTQATLFVSDQQGTEQAIMEEALEASRKAFQETHVSNENLDHVIQESLQQYHRYMNETLEKVKELTKNDMFEEEQARIREAIFQSMNVDGNNNNINDEYGGILKLIVDKGYTIEQAMIGYTVFEEQRNQFSISELIQKIADYLEMQERQKSFLFY